MFGNAGRLRVNGIPQMVYFHKVERVREIRELLLTGSFICLENRELAENHYTALVSRYCLNETVLQEDPPLVRVIKLPIGIVN